MTDIDASPTPYHAAARAAAVLDGAGFDEISRTKPLPSAPGGYYVRVSGGLVAWVIESGGSSFRLIGAHTDSPNLRVRANPDVTSAGWAQVGVETYGGLLANSWLDRDLGVAGRVMVDTEDGAVERLVLDDRPILRIPQLAIHLDRDIRDKGLLLNPQQHLNPLWALGEAEEGAFASHIASLAGVEADSILSWELMAFDLQPAVIVGRDSDLLASARIDNQLSCFVATRALCAVKETWSAEPVSSSGARPTPVLALYDHEEVGSASSTGAAGAFLADLLERISASLGRDRIEHLEAMAASVVVSADGAHATHPNYVDRHEPNHQIVMNGGVVIKRNANQRYATDAGSEGWMRRVCTEADVPVQTYIHRNDLPCGSTIGPITAAELAISTVDIGAPQLAMHSIRELAGVADTDFLGQVLQTAWTSDVA